MNTYKSPMNKKETKQLGGIQKAWHNTNLDKKEPGWKTPNWPNEELPIEVLGVMVRHKETHWQVLSSKV